MKLRLWLAGAATLLVALPSLAVIKTYSTDGDVSTKFPTDRRVYRGDCDENAATPDNGDNSSDQCACTPGSNCRAGMVPDGECGTSSGRPSGGACDPTLTSNLCSGGATPGASCSTDINCGQCQGGTNNGTPCVNNAVCTGGGTCNAGTCNGKCPAGFPLAGSDKPPCNKTDGGSAMIDDDGGGVPTLTSLVLQGAWTDFVGGASVSGIPGTTVSLISTTTIGPAPGQTGAGMTTTTINWGALTGWTQTGRLTCITTCPGGCGGASSCKPFGVAEGTGPPAPLKAASFNTDPWTFSGTGNEFYSSSFEIVSLGLGAVTAATQFGGRMVQIPALPLAALGGLGAGIVYLGARALGRKRD